MAQMLSVESAAAQDVDAAIQKANLYIEVAEMTERAVESWDRYTSWVSMKTGPTGKERYISYGMYEVYDVAGLLKEAQKAAGLEPITPALDAVMKRYINSYVALARVPNRANGYYEREGYRSDGMAEGKALHAEMVPLATAFLAEREAMLNELRPFVRDVEGQEVASKEARDGRSRGWQAANILHAANLVVDLFPRTRPTYIDADMMDAEMQAIGPDTRGEKFDQVIAGVTPPTGVVIDIKQFDAAMTGFAAAVEIFDRFAKEKPEELEDFKDLPRQLLDDLRALREPLAQNQGRDFEGSRPLVGQVVEKYFAMMNEGGSIASSQLRYLQ
ncbi:MAG: DUF3829 domain-containing protein [Hyphomicrobium sp.]